MENSQKAAILGRNHLFPAEKLVILATCFFSLLIIVNYFISHNKNLSLLLVSLLLILIFFKLPAWRQKLPPDSLLFFILSGLPLAGYGYLYKLTGNLVHLLNSGWNDAALARFDCLLFGFSPNLEIVSYYHPWLTELMMLAYVVYLPMLVWLAYKLFKNRGLEGLQSYLFNLGLAYSVCFIIFILIPAASPRFYFPDLQPRTGFIIFRLMNLIQIFGQYQGGSFPSAHCAAGTVMIFSAREAGNKVLLLVGPAILLFFVSTIYGQYHYGLDVLAGILIGLLVVLISRFFKQKSLTRASS